jgi:predicted nucleotidyltransferase/DNA-binding HxlR family transcriptional regulator
MSSIAQHLLGQTRSAVLGALLLHPEDSLHVRELARLTGASPGSLHRELRALADLGLLVRQEIGRQVHYRANSRSPVYEDLSNFLRKTAGVADVLRDTLAGLGKKIEFAFVFGSLASGSERPASDIDVMVLGSATFADLTLALSEAASRLRREVNPTALTTREFAKRLGQGDGFARRVASGPRIWLIGSEDDFAELAANRKA